MTRLFLAAVLLLTRSAAAQDLPGAGGRVLDAGSGRPLAGAKIALVGDADTLRATTDPLGEWRIADARPGRYRLTARALGFRASDVVVDGDQPRDRAAPRRAHSTPPRA